MNVSEVQFKAPPVSLSSQSVFVDEVCSSWWVVSHQLVHCESQSALWETLLILGEWTKGWHPEVTRMNSERKQNVQL